MSLAKNPASESTNNWLNQLFWVLIGAAGVASAYALFSESSLFRILGIQLLVVGATTWWTSQSARLPVSKDETERGQIVEKWSLYYIFAAGTFFTILALSLFSLLISRVEIARPLTTAEIAASAITAVLAASVLTGILHLSKGHSGRYFVGYPSVVMGLHEARVIWFVAAITLLLTPFFKLGAIWIAYLLHIYILAVLIEVIVRLVVAWFQLEREELPQGTEWPNPFDSMVRDVLFTSLNPIDTIFTIAEQRFGLSIRSSWSIRFFRQATLPTVFATCLLLWLSTAVVIIQPNQMALYEFGGRTSEKTLAPGIHFIGPWPLGKVHRVPVKSIQTMQIGFTQEVDPQEVVSPTPRSLLWTEPHANEFALVLGTQSELVSVNAQVYYQIGSSQEQLRDYLYQHSNAESLLEASAYQVLREETQTANLDEILSKNREAFAERIQQQLQSKIATANLGIEVVDVALLSLHPPVQAASAYLDVSNAERDAERRKIEATGDAESRSLSSQRTSAQLVATAKGDAARRIGLASQESSHFVEANKAYQLQPETYRMRLWFDALETTLPKKKVYVIDANLPEVLLADPHAHLNQQKLSTP